MNPKFEWIKSDKFSNISINIAFYKKIDLKDIMAYNLLSSVIEIGTVNYPTKKDLNLKICSLYNATVGFTSVISNDTLIFSLVMDFINPSFVNDENYLSDIFDFAYEVMYNPLLNETKDGFDEKNFNEKKKHIYNLISNIHSNKDLFAYCRFLENMRRTDEGELSLSRTRDVNTILNVSNNHIYELYKDILNNSEIYISGIGNIEEDVIYKYIDKLNLNSINQDYNLWVKKEYMRLEPKKIIETDEVDQAKLFIGYRTDLCPKDKMTASLFVFSMMFGAMYNSTLTTIVREKLSLCYNIGMYYNIKKQFLYVICGTFNDKFDDVINIVDEELKKYQTNNIEDGEMLLDIVKENIKNDDRIYYDSPLNYVFDSIQKLNGRYVDRIKWTNDLMSVSLNDVVEASKLIYLDTIYVMRGEN